MELESFAQGNHVLFLHEDFQDVKFPLDNLRI